MTNNVVSLVGWPKGVDVNSARLPQTYEAAKQALAACTRLDECKTWSDKAQALASYARQSEDDALERLASRIRHRAVRRCGELLKQFQTGPKGGPPGKNNGGGESPVISQRQAAKDAGLSKDQEKQARRVAEIPQEDFDAAVDDDQPPSSVTALIKGTKGDEQNFKQATHLIGAVRRFAEFCKSNDALMVAEGVMPHEMNKIIDQVNIIDAWLDAFVVNLGE